MRKPHRSIRRRLSTALVTVPAMFGVLIAGTALPASAATGSPYTNENTGRCIDDSFAFGLRSFTCNGQDYQLWTLAARNGDWGYHLKNANTGRCIQDNGGTLVSTGCAPVASQQFNALQRTSGTNPIWFSFSNVATSRCIDDSLFFGLRSVSCNQLNYQNWTFTPVFGTY